MNTLKPVISKGKYGEAHIYANHIPDCVLSQCHQMLNQEFTKDLKIRIMPDVHVGKGCMIGTTMQVKDEVCVNLVGADIGCGILIVNMGKIDVDFKKLDDVITKFIPLGFAKHSVISKTSEDFFKNNPIIAQISLETPMRSIGTLGGGNHFIEICVDSETGDKHLVIHTGSRNLGKQIAEYWHKVGIEKSQAGIKELATIKGEDLENYLKDTFVVQKYASLNRETIARVILEKTFDLNLDDLYSFETIHNYIDPVDKILRKGAISAKKDEKVLIPLNMRDGSLICKGKGNPDWNESAPHGAGRILSRGQAKECVDLEEFVDSMKGIYSSSVGTNTLDEAPMVYKNSEDIKKCIVDTVEVIKHIKPIYNRKA